MSKKDPLIGTTLGEYKIKKMVGKGGMSRVYQAVDQNLGRDVAIKIITLDPDRAKELMKRFDREGKTIGKLDKHPNIIRVHRYGAEGDIRYLAMEFIEGETLTQRMSRYKNQGDGMPYTDVINIMRQVADALDYAHQHSVIHRDIKPSNIMIEEDAGRAVLMDFGLVMQANTNTTLGTAFGTPRYISPEQAISSQQAVPQSDIYSLAVIIYEMLVGQTPFEDESAMSLALSHITNPPPNPRDVREDLPDEAADVLLKGLEKSPEDRYQTAKEMVEALAAALDVEVDGVVTAMVAPVLNEPLSATKDDDDHTTHRPNEPVNDQVAPEKKPAPEPVPAPAAVAAGGSASNPDPAPAKNNKKSGAKPAQASKSSKSAKSSGAGKSAKQANPPRPPKSAPVTTNGSNNNRRLFVYGFFGIIMLLMAVVAGITMLDSNGGDTGVRPEGDVQLEYTNDYMVIYNQSDRTLNLVGLEFVLPNGSSRFVTRDFGQTRTLPNVAPDQCLVVRLRGVDIDPPDYCDDETTVESLYNNQTSSQTLYWVWLEGLENETFHVVLDGEILATCQVEQKICYFSVP